MSSINRVRIVGVTVMCKPAEKYQFESEFFIMLTTCLCVKKKTIINNVDKIGFDGAQVSWQPSGMKCVMGHSLMLPRTVWDKP